MQARRPPRDPNACAPQEHRPSASLPSADERGLRSQERARKCESVLQTLGRLMNEDEGLDDITGTEKREKRTEAQSSSGERQKGHFHAD